MKANGSQSKYDEMGPADKSYRVFLLPLFEKTTIVELFIICAMIIFNYVWYFH